MSAIAGDIIGSVCEYAPINTKEFELFHPAFRFIDDTVLTGAVTDAAMRVAAIACLLDTEAEVLDEARRSAASTQGRPEGIRGAEAVALAVLLARMGENRAFIRCRIEEMFGIIAFLDSGSWEDAVRNSISLGGDSDTQACIAGTVADAYYGRVPEEVRARVPGMLPEDMRQVIGELRRWHRFPVDGASGSGNCIPMPTLSTNRRFPKPTGTAFCESGNPPCRNCG